ncbi:lytic murein transglycosylase [Agrobacterium sp. 33MFTa1.1]|nr:lytic murein transglycosylase [Agrobacterium sp. 33MFTa1.1]
MRGEVSASITPLCPAGHLPLKGGDRLVVGSRPSQRLRMKRWSRLLPISPLEGEMPGRAEGGKPHPRNEQRSKTP